MKERLQIKRRILETLHALRRYGVEKGHEFSLFYHEETSTLMRFANSAISLNTNEHLIRLNIETGSGRKRASYEMITDLNQLEEMKRGIDIAVEMLEHVQPLEYDPTVARFTETFADESGYDPELAAMTGEEKLACFNQAVAGLETEQLRLSGIFSSGVNIVAQINTTSEHTQFFCTTDAQMTVVLAHEQDKWEVQSERSAQRKADLDPAAIRSELAFLVERFTTDPALQLPLGRYDIVFGPAATADLVSIMNWVGFNGGTMMRGYSFLTEEQLGKQVFSPQFSLVDDASRRETFPFRRDYYGMPRTAFPIFTDGVFQAFTWEQDEADEFGRQATGHTVHHSSLVLHGGEEDVASLEALAAKPRRNDLLYVPFLHYMNLVNPSRGVVTASSRFGALLLKADGTTVIPFNFRLTQSVLDIFGEKIAWMSQQTTAYNTSSSYGARNPTSVIVPCFIRVNDLEVSHSNASF